MKRCKQGYVMVLVLAVMLLLTSVASVVAATSVRNIESSGVNTAADLKLRQTESLIEEYYAYWNAQKGGSFEYLSDTEIDPFQEFQTGKLVSANNHFSVESDSKIVRTAVIGSVTPTGDNKVYTVTITISEKVGTDESYTLEQLATADVRLEIEETSSYPETVYETNDMGEPIFVDEEPVIKEIIYHYTLSLNEVGFSDFDLT